jgi:hypothetical protein
MGPFLAASGRFRSTGKGQKRNFSAEEWQLYFPGKKYNKTFPDLPGPD